MGGARYGTGVQHRRPVPDVHSRHGLLGAQQLADDGGGHDAGRVADLRRHTETSFLCP